MRHTLRMTNTDHVEDGAKWARELVQRIGRAIKEARGGRSASWLSDRTAELGYRVSPTVIAKLDSGHRGSVLSVAELLVLAAALDVPPVALIYPDLPDGPVEVVPGQSASSIDGLLRFTGEIGSSADSDAGKLIKLSREIFHKRIAARVRRDFLIELVDELPEESTAEQAAAVVSKVNNEIAKAEDLRNLTLQVTAIPGSVVDDHA